MIMYVVIGNKYSTYITQHSPKQLDRQGRPTNEQLPTDVGDFGATLSKATMEPSLGYDSSIGPSSGLSR